MLIPIVKFSVEGVPVGKGRPKFARRGNFVQAYTPTKTKTYEQQVADAARVAMGSKLRTMEPVQVNQLVTKRYSDNPRVEARIYEVSYDEK